MRPGPSTGSRRPEAVGPFVRAQSPPAGLRHLALMGRWLILLLASLLTLPGPAAATALNTTGTSTATRVQNCARASSSAAPDRARVIAAGSSCKRPGSTGRAARFAVGCCVGARGASAADAVLPTPTVSTPGKLRNIVHDLYRGTTNPHRVGNGTTMDAIRHELRTGQAVHRRRHLEKGKSYSNGLRNWLRANPNAPLHDRRGRARGGDDVVRMSTSQSWGRSQTLGDHFKRHGVDFGARSANDYARMSSEFFQRAQRHGLPTKVDSRGVVRVWDPQSNTFGSYNPNGTTRTFFKPDPSNHPYQTNQDYWNAQPGRAPWTP